MRGRVLGAAAVVSYNTWLAGPFLTGDAGVLSGYLSELAAADQPYQWFFRLGDLLAAAVFATIAVLGRTGWSYWLGQWSSRVSAALLAAAGATALDAVVNLPCAESRNAACAAVPSLSRRIHEISSVSVGIALLAVIGLVAAALVQQDGWSPAARSCAGLALAVGALMAASAVAPWAAPGTQGATQAVQVLACSIWVGMLAWRLPSGTMPHD